MTLSDNFSVEVDVDFDYQQKDQNRESAVKNVIFNDKMTPIYEESLNWPCSYKGGKYFERFSKYDLLCKCNGLRLIICGNLKTPIF